MMKFSKILITLLSIYYTIIQALPLDTLKLPPGFTIDVYADNVTDARSMTLADNGIVFVGSRDAGKIYALIPNPNLNKAAQVITVAKDLDLPNGIAFHQGNLYVAEKSRIIRYDDILHHLINPPKPVLIYDNLPYKNAHNWRYLAISPDNWLYVTIGAPCNICLSDDPRFATILRMQLDGTQAEIYAKGIRNSLGLAWHPQTKELWFTDNGRDWMGDDLPPDKLNHAPHSGMDFGYPYYHAKNLPDPKYGKERSPAGITFPALNLRPHVAALGMVFYTGKMFPAEYQNQIFIAEHGSWNRTNKIGYDVIWVKLENNKPISSQPFITGWLQGEMKWGRPVDLLVMPDGALLISDDFANVVYRVTYSGKVT